jgi:NADPH-dependent 7-cyano-7-deazaguanine reductase QueF-like protein
LIFQVVLTTDGNQIAESDSFEDALKSLESEKVEAMDETKVALKQLDQIRAQCERTEKALSDLQTQVVDKDIELLVPLLPFVMLDHLLC